jgi:hypothetical protein
LIVAICGFMQCAPTSFFIVPNHNHSHNRGILLHTVQPPSLFNAANHSYPHNLGLRFLATSHIWHFEEHMLF